jgi:phosphoglycolate phosphatase (TIGR01487 family)
MHYHVLACDYDGTLAFDGKVSERHVLALEKLIASGRKLVLVTGRRLESLRTIFPHIHLFDKIIAENGAVIYDPKTHEQETVTEAYSQILVERLKQRGVEPIEVGHSIIATWQPHEFAMLDSIRELGLELQVIFNKGAIMAVPSGICKGSGLKEALFSMGQSIHNTVVIGDAENDHALFNVAECTVAVANAIPAIKDRADYVTLKDHGDGVTELIDMLINNDLKNIAPKLHRHDIVIGTSNENNVYFSPYNSNMLICGSSGCGKSMMAQGILERLESASYQYCLIDPEGDFENLPGGTILGSSHGVPTIEEVVHVLKNPKSNVVVNLLGLAISDRPEYFALLLPHIQKLRMQYGRPHWLVIDEAHYLLSSKWQQFIELSEQQIKETILITVHPNQLPEYVLKAMNTIIVLGESPNIAFEDYCRIVNIQCPMVNNVNSNKHTGYIWLPNGEQSPAAFVPSIPANQHHRHLRKYADGNLGDYHSFYFTGPNKKLNIKAHNLYIFNQIAEGIDDETWQYHLRRHDYSRWFKNSINDKALAQITENIESNIALTSSISRKRIQAAIEERYTLPV